MNKYWKLFIGSWILFVSWNLVIGSSKVSAIYEPLSVPNNKYGVHILEPGEIAQAANLVNSSGGDWGYVTVPIRSDDRDREKWTEFFTKAGKLHLIPLVRLATYPDGDTWVRPNVYDLVDFANFLQDMPWPTQNRYIILFNEPNHAKEWGGEVDPKQYTSLLLDARDIFKARSADFFLLSAGLDMSAPSNHTSLDALEFYRRMTPGWLNSTDGLSFHAYPNPAFSAPVTSKTRFGPTSYRYELNYLKSNKPIFITETGSTNPNNFYPQAFTIFTDTQIVAITPFILYAGAGEFTKFSLLNTPAYNSIQNLTKISGSPHLISDPSNPSNPSIKINDLTLPVELADTPEKITQGLSDRQTLDENTGMLFVFTKPTQSPFWMYHMNFALDFIWIKDGQVVQLNENIPPPTTSDLIPKVITPNQPIDHVLEVNAGFIKKHDIKIGHEVDYGQ
ncbi:MAG: hypothetical protein G01um101416_437 [Microgenomates group bacterium Gr01-1014_16]|nr:MAG: hypothetical protein G01um101416_437 [Microgenomates group bacterium Gr01-1014_16]